jgi:predicted nucleic acid-binding protein
MPLVDSDVLVLHLRGHEAARDYLVRVRRALGPLAISVVSVAEISGGMRSAERRSVWDLLGSFVRVPVDDDIARRAGEFARRFRRSHSGIGIADYLIAATADIHELELATLNVKHFPMMRGLRPAFTI